MDRGGLPLGIGVHGRRLDVRSVLEQALKDVDRLPDTARDEVAEQGDVRVRNVVVYLALVNGCHQRI